jgi:hypothetical protein
MGGQDIEEREPGRVGRMIEQAEPVIVALAAIAGLVWVGSLLVQVFTGHHIGII